MRPLLALVCAFGVLGGIYFYMGRVGQTSFAPRQRSLVEAQVTALPFYDPEKTRVRDIAPE